jgi:hypothetical protein
MLLAETMPGIIETEEENERTLESANRLMSKTQSSSPTSSNGI